MRGEGRYFALPDAAHQGAETGQVRRYAAEKLADIPRLWPEGYDRAARVEAVQRILDRPNTVTWLLHDPEAGRAVGAVWASSIQPGHTCDLHMGCWDGQLLDKAAALESCIDALFHMDEWSEWEGLVHVGCRIPSHSFATAWWAVRELGFGGAFTYRLDGKAIPVEGVRTRCMPWGGELHDLILLGRHATVEGSGAETTEKREAARRPS